MDQRSVTGRHILLMLTAKSAITTNTLTRTRQHAFTTYHSTTGTAAIFDKTGKFLAVRWMWTD